MAAGRSWLSKKKLHMADVNHTKVAGEKRLIGQKDSYWLLKLSEFLWVNRDIGTNFSPAKFCCHL